MADCTRPTEDPRDDACGCYDRFGFEGMDRWCNACRDAYDRWCDDQAERSRQEDRASGLGWLYHQLIGSEN